MNSVLRSGRDIIRFFVVWLFAIEIVGLALVDVAEKVIAKPSGFGL